MKHSRTLKTQNISVLFTLVICAYRFGISPVKAAGVQGDIRICNEGSSKREVAFMFRNKVRIWDKTWSSSGWKEVPAGGCRIFVDNFSGAFEAYVAIAKTNLFGNKKSVNVKWKTSHRFGYESTEQFCAGTDNFRRGDIVLSQHKVCPSGYEPFLFSIYLHKWAEKGVFNRVLTIK